MKRQKNTSKGGKLKLSAMLFIALGSLILVPSLLYLAAHLTDRTAFLIFPAAALGIALLVIGGLVIPRAEQK